MLQIRLMRRYLALSILLHLLVFVSFIYNKNTIIDDPIVAVSLDLREPVRARSAKSVEPSQSNSNFPKSAKPESAAASNNENAGTDQTDTLAYESGNVSVKPKVIKQIQVVYPQQAKAARVEGAVRLAVVINEMGRVFEVRVLEGPGYGLNEAAQDALKQFVFSPAEVEGKKVPVRIVYVYRFKLESR